MEQFLFITSRGPGVPPFGCTVNIEETIGSGYTLEGVLPNCLGDFVGHFYRGERVTWVRGFPPLGSWIMPELPDPASPNLPMFDGV